MFEGWVANLFNRVLGSYVEENCFRPEKVNASVYSGHVVLSELEIRKDALDSVEAPIKLRRGFIGQVEFKIPWTHLGSRPVEISIDRVFLVLEPSLEYNAKEYERKGKARKKADLARTELRKSSGSLFGDRDNLGKAGSSEAEEMAKAGFTARLMNKIVDNIELNIRNIHVRYEDRVTNRRHAFSAGFTIESLKMQSTDKFWNPCFVDLVREVQKRLGESGKYLEKLLAYKLFKMNHFAVYWNPFPSPQGERPINYETCTFTEMAAVFGRMIARQQEQEDEDFRRVSLERQAQQNILQRSGMPSIPKSRSSVASSRKKQRYSNGPDGEQSQDSASEKASSFQEAVSRAAYMSTTTKQVRGVDQHRYILRPISITLKMRSSRDPRFGENPNLLLDIEVQSITVAMERFQYIDAVEMLAAFDAAEKSYRYAEFRPSDKPVKHHPRVWWQFAIRAIREQVADRLKRYKGDYIEQRRKYRLEYMDLWKRNLVGRPAYELQPRRTPDIISSGPSSFAGMVPGDDPRTPTQAQQTSTSDVGKPTAPATPSADLYTTQTPMRQKRDMMLRGAQMHNRGRQTPSNVPTPTVIQYLELDRPGRLRLEYLEDELEVEDIMFFRSLAETELRLERAELQLYQIEKRQAMARGIDPVKAEAGWVGSLFGWAGWAVGLNSQSSDRPNTPNSKAPADVEFPLGMTPEERETLLSMLDFDPTHTLFGGTSPVKKVTSPGRIVSITRFRVRSGSLELWNNEDETQPTLHPPTVLVDGHFEGLRVKISERANGTSLTKVSLGNLVVFDRCGGNSRFARIVALKETLLAEHVSSCLSTISDGGALERASHATPPSYSGISERMEKNYLRKRHADRLNRLRAAKYEKLSRQQDSLGGGAAWAAMMGGLDLASSPDPNIGSVNSRPFEDVPPEPLGGLDTLETEEFSDDDFDADEEDGISRDGSSAGPTPRSRNPRSERIYPGSIGFGKSFGFRGTGYFDDSYLPSTSPNAAQAGPSPLFVIEIDNYCPDSSADVSLRVRTQPLEVVYSKLCMEKVGKFFKVPETVSLFKEVQFDTINRFTNIQSRNRAKMEYAFRNHFCASMDVDVQAPLLIIPQHAPAKREQDTNLLLIDFGRMTIKDRNLSTVKSEAKQHHQFQQSASKRPGTAKTTSNKDETASSLQNDTDAEGVDIDEKNARSSPGLSDSFKPETISSSNFFDDYSVSCTSVQVLVTNAAAPWRSIVDQQRLRMHIIEQFTFNLLICVSILQYDRTLPKFKVFASLPSLQLHLSAEKYQALFQIVESLNDGKKGKDRSSKTSLEQKGPYHPVLRRTDSTLGLRSEEFVLDSIASRTLMERNSSVFSEPRADTPGQSSASIADLNITLPSSPSASFDLSKMEPIQLGSSSASVTSVRTSRTGSGLPDKFIKLQRSDSTSGRSGSNFGKPQTSTSTSTGTSSGDSKLPSQQSHAKNFDDLETSSLSLSLYDTLQGSGLDGDDPFNEAHRSMLNGQHLSDAQDDIENDFFTTIGSVTQSPFFKNVTSGESVGSFVSALQGDDFDIDEEDTNRSKKNDSNGQIITPKARPNVSVVQCSLSINLITITFTRKKIDQSSKRSLKRATSRSKRDLISPQNSHELPEGSGFGSPIEEFGSSPPSLLKPFVKDWLDELSALKETEKLPPPHAASGVQHSKQRRSSSLMHDQVLDDILIGEDENDLVPVREEEGLIVVVFDSLSFNASIRTLDTSVDLSLKRLTVRNVLREGIASLRSLTALQLDSFPVLVSSNIPKGNSRSFFERSAVFSTLSKLRSTPDLGPVSLAENVLSFDLKAAARDSPLYAGVGVQVSAGVGTLICNFDQEVIGAILEAFVTPVPPFELVEDESSEIGDPAKEKSIGEEDVGETISEAEINQDTARIATALHREISHQRSISTPTVFTLDEDIGRAGSITTASGEVSAQIVATLKSLVINFMDKRPISDESEESASLRPIARVTTVDLEVRKVDLYDGESIVSAQLGNFTVADMLTGIGTTFDHQQKANQRENQTYTIPEQNPLSEEEPSLVEVIGSKKRKSDGRPLLLLHSTIFPPELQERRLWTFTKSDKDTTPTPYMPDAEDSSSPTRPLLDLDEVLDSLLQDSPTSSPREGMHSFRMESKENEPFFPSYSNERELHLKVDVPPTDSDVGCRHSRCRRKRRNGLPRSSKAGPVLDSEANHESAVDHSAIPIPHLPLQNEVRVQVRSAFIRTNVEFFQEMVDYFFEGKIFRVLRNCYLDRAPVIKAEEVANFGSSSNRDPNEGEERKQRMPYDLEKSFTGISEAEISRQIRRSTTIPKYSETKSLSLISFQASLFEVSVELPSSQRGSPMGTFFVQSVTSANHFFLGDASVAEKEFLIRHFSPSAVSAMHAIESAEIQVQNACFLLPNRVDPHVPVKVLENVSASIRIVKVLGSALVVPAPEVQVENHQYWRWTLQSNYNKDLLDELMLSRAPLKVKVTCDMLRFRFSEEQIVSMFGIADHFSILNMPAFSQKLQTMGEHVNPNERVINANSVVSQEAERNNMLVVECASVCSCSTVDSEPSPLRKVPPVTCDGQLGGISVELLVKKAPTSEPPIAPRLSSISSFPKSISSSSFRSNSNRSRRSGSSAEVEYASLLVVEVGNLVFVLIEPAPSNDPNVLDRKLVQVGVESCVVLDSRQQHLRDSAQSKLLDGFSTARRAAKSEPTFKLTTEENFVFMEFDQSVTLNTEMKKLELEDSFKFVLNGLRFTFLEGIIEEAIKFMESTQVALRMEGLWPPRPFKQNLITEGIGTIKMAKLLRNHFHLQKVLYTQLRLVETPRVAKLAHHSKRNSHLNTRRHRRSQSHRLAIESVVGRVQTNPSTSGHREGGSSIGRSLPPSSTISNATSTAVQADTADEFKSSHPITRSHSLDSVSVAPVQSWVSELSERGSEAGRTWGGQSSTSLNRTIPHTIGGIFSGHGKKFENSFDFGQQPVRYLFSIGKGQHVKVKLGNVEVCLAENPKQVDSMVLALGLGVDVSTSMFDTTQFSIKLADEPGTPTQLMLARVSSTKEDGKLPAPPQMPAIFARIKGCRVFFFHEQLTSGSRRPSSVPVLAQEGRFPNLFKSHSPSSPSTPEKVSEVVSSMVEPFTASISYKQCIRNKRYLNHDIDLQIGEIVSRVTYREIRILTVLMKRLQEMVQRLKTREQGDIVRVPTPKSSKDLARFSPGKGSESHSADETLDSPVESRHRPNLSTPATRLRQNEILDSVRPIPPTLARVSSVLPPAPKQSQALVQTGQIKLSQAVARFLLVDDIYGQLTPVMELEVPSTLLVTELNKKGKVKLSAKQTFSCDYFNHRLSSWEPLVEEWTFRIDGRFSIRNNRHHLNERQPRHPRSLVLSSENVLNVNATEAFIEAVSGASKIWNHGSLGGRDELSSASRLNGGLFRIRNETGLGIAYWENSSKDGHIYSLQSGEESPMKLRSGDSSFLGSRDQSIGASQRNGKCITVIVKRPQSISLNKGWNGANTLNPVMDDSASQQASAWLPLTNLPIERDGSFEFLLKPTLPTEEPIQVTCDIVSVGSTKVIFLRSNLLVRNRCVGPIEVHISSKREDTPLFQKKVLPGEVVPIPVHIASLVNSRKVEIGLRPLSYGRAFQFRLLVFPPQLGPDCAEPSALRTTLHFVNDVGASGPERNSSDTEISSFCAVDCRSGREAIEGLRRAQAWDKDHMGEPQMQGGSTAAALSLLSQRLEILDIDNPRKSNDSRVVSERRAIQSGTSLRLISFESPLVLSNLLATPVTYRLRSLTNNSSSAADGQLLVGTTLRWQGVDPGSELSLTIRLPGFDWSSVLKLEGILQEDLSRAGDDSKHSAHKNTSDNGMKTAVEGLPVGSLGEMESRFSQTVRWTASHNDVGDGIILQKTIELKDANRRSLSVCVEVERLASGTRKLVLYVPYWIVNSSDLHLLVRSASRSATWAETFGGHIAAGQNEAMAVMRRLRMRQKLGERFIYQKGLTGTQRAPGGLLDILDDPNVRGDRRPAEPLMFSYTDVSRMKGRICVKTADSGWSQPMGLDSAGTSGLIELKQQWNVKSDIPRQVFVLGVNISVAEGRFHRTKVITLTPRFVLINALGRTLKVKQRQQYSYSLSGQGGLFSIGNSFSKLLGFRASASSQAFLQGTSSASGSILTTSEVAASLRPGERSPFHWWDLNAPREICVRFDEYGWIWSGGFCIDNIGEFYVRLRNEHTHAVYILRVDVSLDKSSKDGSTILISFHPELPALPPYRVDNLSLQTIRLQQKGAPAQTQQVLLPYHSCPYTWDDLSLPRMLVVESLANKANTVGKWKSNPQEASFKRKAMNFFGGVWGMLWDQSGLAGAVMKASPVRLGEFELDRLQSSMPSSALSHINVGVYADGPTRVLSIVDARNKEREVRGDGFAGGIPSNEGQDEWPVESFSNFDIIRDDEEDDDDSSTEASSSLELTPNDRDQVLEEDEDEESHFALDFTDNNSHLSDSAKERKTHAFSGELEQVSEEQSNARETALIDSPELIDEEAERNTPAAGNGRMHGTPEKMNGKRRSLKETRLRTAQRNPRAGPSEPVDGLGKAFTSMKDEDDSGTPLEVHLLLKGIGISLVESLPRRELMYISVLDIRSEYGMFRNMSRVVLKVGWLQVDNQLYGAYYPVMLAPRSWNRAALAHNVALDGSRKLKNESAKQHRIEDGSLSTRPRIDTGSWLKESSMLTQDITARDERGEQRPFAEFCLLSSNKFSSLDFVRYVSALVLPMNLKLEPELLSACLNFTTRCVALTGPASSFQQRQDGIGAASSTVGGPYLSRRGLTSLSRTKSSSNPRHLQTMSPRFASRGVVLSGGREASSYTMLMTSESSNMGDAPTSPDSPFARSNVSGSQLSRELNNASEIGSRRGSGSTGNVLGLHSNAAGASIGSGLSTSSAGVMPATSQDMLPVSQRKLYIEELHIHPVKVHVSFSFRNSGIAKTRPTRRDGDSVSHSHGPESISVNPLRFALNAMGASLANVENAPLRLNALVLHNSLSTRETILERVLGHYRSQALRQAYLILGSVDLLGDPRGLVQNLGAGVLDFFYEPALGLVRSPKDFGAGIAKGTLSLFRRVVLGAATSATGFANGVSALFDTLSNDRYTGFKPRSVTEGIVQGIAGLVVAPMNGLLEEGAVGLGQGIFYGLMGLVFKPLAGLLKLVKRVSVAIQSTIDPSVKYRRHRIRPPRSFRRLNEGRDTGSSAMKLLEPFNLYEAVGEEVLAAVDHGKYLVEGHLGHMLLELPELVHEFSLEELERAEETGSTIQRGEVEKEVQRQKLEASFAYSFYTLHERRPLRSLALWNDMYLVATRSHLLYVEAVPGEYSEDERSNWALSIHRIKRVEICKVDLVAGRDFEIDSMHDIVGDGGSEEAGGDRVHPDLRYWTTRVICKVGVDEENEKESTVSESGREISDSEGVRKNGVGASPVYVICTWTEADANHCLDFIRSIQRKLI